MADHFNPGDLRPAAHHNGVAFAGAEVHQPHEPLRYVTTLGHIAALDDRFIGLNIDHTDAIEIAAVEDGVHHQFGHGRVVDMRGQRHPQRRRGILRVGAKLVAVLLPRAFQGHHKVAAENDKRK